SRWSVAPPPIGGTPARVRNSQHEHFLWTDLVNDLVRKSLEEYSPNLPFAEAARYSGVPSRIVFDCLKSNGQCVEEVETEPCELLLVPARSFLGLFFGFRQNSGRHRSRPRGSALRIRATASRQSLAEKSLFFTRASRDSISSFQAAS